MNNIHSNQKIQDIVNSNSPIQIKINNYLKIVKNNIKNNIKINHEDLSLILDSRTNIEKQLSNYLFVDNRNYPIFSIDDNKSMTKMNFMMQLEDDGFANTDVDNLIKNRILLRKYNEPIYCPAYSYGYNIIDGKLTYNTCKLEKISKDSPYFYDENNKNHVQLVDMFKNHLKLICENDKFKYDVLLHYIHFIIRNKTQLRCWAIVITSTLQGIGKTMLKSILKSMFNDSRLVTSVEGKMLSRSFNGWASQGAIISVIEELKIDSRMQDEVQNKMKSILSDDDITVERKGLDSVTSINHTNYIIFSNYSDAIKITQDDRRYFIINNELEDRSDSTWKKANKYRLNYFDYFEKLSKLIEPQNAMVIRSYFEQTDIPEKFLKQSTAPNTNMSSLFKSTDRANLYGYDDIENLIDENTPYINNQYIILDKLKESVSKLPNGDAIMAGYNLSKVIRSMGYSLKQFAVFNDNERIIVYTKSSDVNKDSIRARIKASSIDDNKYIEKIR